MKLHFLSLLAAAIMVSCSTTQSSSSSNFAYGSLPQVIRADFEKLYPSATNVTVKHYDFATTPIDWALTEWDAMDENDFAITFNIGRDQYNAWYDSDGTWIGSAYSMNNSSLPSNLTTTLNAHFNGYAIDNIQLLKHDDTIGYYVKLKKGEAKVKLLMDVNGNIIKQKDK